MLPYKVIPATAIQIPVLISVPHCSIQFPDELKQEFDPSLIARPDDTDWFVDKLYDFAPSIGITMITAVYSRWVIDLNRDPESKPLYNDGRIITGLCPTTTFLGEPLYKDIRDTIKEDEVQRRLKLYYMPYHEKLQELLGDIKTKFGTVLLWDSHSIRQVVSTIQKDKFPDLILGDVDESSASKKLIGIALGNLGSDRYSLQHNYPFKGGHITRHYGKPSERQHALQLEMTKVNYMDDAEVDYDVGRAERMAALLRNTLLLLAKQLTS